MQVSIQRSVQKALNMGNWGSIVLTALASIGLVYYILPETMILRGIEFTKWGVLGAIAVGLSRGYADEHHHGILYRYGQGTRYVASSASHQPVMPQT